MRFPDVEASETEIGVCSRFDVDVAWDVKGNSTGFRRESNYSTGCPAGCGVVVIDYPPKSCEAVEDPETNNGLYPYKLR